MASKESFGIVSAGSGIVVPKHPVSHHYLISFLHWAWEWLPIVIAEIDN